MTNREWLNSLNDEELAQWMCCDEYYVVIKGKNETSRNGLGWTYSNTVGGMAKWLKEKRQMKKIIMKDGRTIEDDGDVPYIIKDGKLYVYMPTFTGYQYVYEGEVEKEILE